MEVRIRQLRPEDVEVRVQSSKNGKTRLLLYITSRSVVTLLDEAVGCTNWCSDIVEVNGLSVVKIGIWDSEKNMFVYRADVGSESNIEKEKGLISDGYKRCLARWGLIDLYTTPEIVVPEVQYEKYRVTRLEYKEGSRALSELTIVDSKNTIVFNWSYEGGTTVSASSGTQPRKEKPKSDWRIETVEELHTFCNARVKEVGGELRKPIIEFAKNFGDKTEKMLPLNNAMAVWLSWLGKENNPIIRGSIDVLRDIWKK